METRRVVIEQMWELLAISSIDSESARYFVLGAFLHKGSSELRSPQTTKPRANGGGDAYEKLAIGKDLCTLGKDR